MSDNESIPCEICGEPTMMLGTKRCDPCWEIESRIVNDPKRYKQVKLFLSRKADQKQEEL